MTVGVEMHESTERRRALDTVYEPAFAGHDVALTVGAARDLGLPSPLFEGDEGHRLSDRHLVLTLSGNKFAVDENLRVIHVESHPRPLDKVLDFPGLAAVGE